jgi:hypothetical protein
MRGRAASAAMGCAVLHAALLLGASDHYGRVTFHGQPVPGATITATQRSEQVSTASDEEGVYHLAALADGVWTVTIEMTGFGTVTREVTVRAGAPPETWELTLLRPAATTERRDAASDAAPAQPVSSQPTSGSVPAKAAAASAAPAPAAAAPAAPAAPAAGRAATAVRSPTAVNPAATNATNATSGTNGTNGTNAASVAAPDDPAAENSTATADGFLINGSVNNAAASPFAQPAAFGNNRRRAGTRHYGGLALALGDSRFDARPFSFATPRPPKPEYGDVRLVGTYGGLLRLPRVENPTAYFVGYQHNTDHQARTQSAIVPTPLERGGDFSHSSDAFGRPIAIIDPITGSPFAGNVIPVDRLSPQAAALLAYYPRPNLDGSDRINYQAPVFRSLQQDDIQSRLTQRLGPRDQLFSTIAYQHTAAETTTLFGFTDASDTSGFDGAISWTRRFAPRLSVRFRYQFTRRATVVTPYFAGRTNVAGEAGIAGSSQDPLNWGPPTLVFASGIAGLGDAQAQSLHDGQHAASTEAFVNVGRHNLTFGGELHRQLLDTVSPLDARGTFAFTGASSGSDVADFLLGLPRTGAIASGDVGRNFRGSSYVAYFTDDWRVGPGLTLNLGARWEYETPLHEARGRLVNLDVAPHFAAVAAVVPAAPDGPLTGQSYPDSLLRPDRRGLQPRLAMTWRPVPAAPLVIRTGYGIYRNTSTYPALTTLLAQQPPFATTLSVASSNAHPLTLANGLLAPAGGALGTFAVDPDFRVGYAHNWQLAVQRDLPGSLTTIVTYLGTAGRHLIQQFLPNTYPAGAINPCPACPAGFVYVTSNGDSSRHAGQLLLRRRLRNGLMASVEYTWAKAIDNAATFSGGNASGTVGAIAAGAPPWMPAAAGRGAQGLDGASIAQDWLNLDAERGPSTFDQRHRVVAQGQYSTAGLRGAAPAAGWRDTLLRDWTVTADLTIGSGLPFTPLSLTNVPGTGIIGVRADRTATPADAIPPGAFLNPAAYAPPASGHWGSAGRNSVRGPAQFDLNAGLMRTVVRGDRLQLEWRLDATNVLNHVTYANVNAIVGSTQFGLPTLANPMRKLSATVRIRF